LIGAVAIGGAASIGTLGIASRSPPEAAHRAAAENRMETFRR
jgi:hypothetical protein